VIDPTAPLESELEAYREFQDDLAEISANAAADRLKAEAQYEEDRTDIIADYAQDRQNIIESAEKRIADLHKSIAEDIADVHEDAAKREADQIDDYNERIADMREDYYRDEERRLENFQRDEERAKRQHMLTLLGAVASLDARAVWMEQARYDQQRADRQEDFNIETQQRAEDFAERLQQEQEAHEERLQEAREADQERIADLRARLAEEEAAIRADTEQKLAMLHEQHMRELASLDEQHARRLAQIDQQAAEERARRQKQFENELISLGGHYGSLLAAQRQGQAAIAASFAEWWASMAAAANANQSDLDPYDEHLKEVQPDSSGYVDPRHDEGEGGPGGYAAGGLAPRTGLFKLHGRPDAPERILSSGVTAMVNRMAGGHSDAALFSAMADGQSGGSTGGISVAIDMDINVAGNLDSAAVADIKQEVRAEIYDVLVTIAGKKNS
jgi:hypothetical protein